MSLLQQNICFPSILSKAKTHSQASFHCRFVCEWHLIYDFSVLTEAACTNKWSDDKCADNAICNRPIDKENCQKTCGKCPEGNIDTKTTPTPVDEDGSFFLTILPTWFHLQNKLLFIVGLFVSGI